MSQQLYRKHIFLLRRCPNQDLNRFKHAGNDRYLIHQIEGERSKGWVKSQIFRVWTFIGCFYSCFLLFPCSPFYFIPCFRFLIVFRDFVWPYTINTTLAAHVKSYEKSFPFIYLGSWYQSHSSNPLHQRQEQLRASKCVFELGVSLLNFELPIRTSLNLFSFRAADDDFPILVIEGTAMMTPTAVPTAFSGHSAPLQLDYH